jgi:hypothetical protein
MSVYSRTLAFLLFVCTGTVLGSEAVGEEHNIHQVLNGVSNYTFNDTSEASSSLPDILEWGVVCDDVLPFRMFLCGKNNSLAVSLGVCATAENGTLEVGQCLYNYGQGSYIDVPKNMSLLNSFMCNTSDLHRTGTLCGKCQDGYSPLAYSYEMKCIKCPNGKSNWWKFLLAAFLPLTIFYIIILFFKINVVSSRFQGFIFYSQMISLPAMIRIHLMYMKYPRTGESYNELGLRVLAAFYGIWNLDFFRSVDFGICLGTDSLHTLVLDLIVGGYPLLLMVMSYALIGFCDRNLRPLVIIVKPFHTLFGLFRENWDLRTSLIDAFATVFLLTNVKFQSVCLDLLLPVTVYDLTDSGNWTYSLRLFYDGTVLYFGPRHLPYGIVAIVMVVLFAILPVLLLVLYPFRCFQKILNRFPFRWYILHTFVDSFYGCYKDGTQPGTRDCRWFASLLILSRLSLILLGGLTLSAVYYPLAAVVLVVVVFLYIAVQPFRERVSHFTTINVLFILLLAELHVCSNGIVKSEPPLQYVFLVNACLALTLPLLYISALVLHWVYTHRRFRINIWSRIHAWWRGYATL